MRNSTIVSLIRHGETDYNAQKIVQGHLDVPLNAEGEAQARIAGRFLADVAFDESYASDLKRAQRTSAIIMEYQEGSTTKLELDPRIRERYLGEIEGKRWGDPGANIDTIEPAQVLQARLLSFWDSLFLNSPSLVDKSALSSTPATPPVDSTSSSRRILITSHGGSIRQLVSALLMSRDFELDLPQEHQAEGTSRRVANCSITEFIIDEVLENGEWRERRRLTKYADDSFFIGSSRIPSPSENVDIVE